MVHEEMLALRQERDHLKRLAKDMQARDQDLGFELTEARDRLRARHVALDRMRDLSAGITEEQ
jgi:hypothetical protein